MNKLTTIVLLAWAGASLAAAPAAPAAPEGLYLMTRFWMNSGLEIRTYWFHNGDVVVNPIASVKTLDVPAEKAKHPNDVGTYRIEGGQLRFTFPNSDRTSRFESIPGGFGWDAGIFAPVEVFKPGATLEGTFSGGSSVNGGAVAASTTITFQRDGTYSSESVTTYSLKAPTEASGGSTGKERGKYRIDGTALHMTPDGGKEMVYNTFPYDDQSEGPAPRGVFLGSTLLRRAR